MEKIKFSLIITIVFGYSMFFSKEVKGIIDYSLRSTYSEFDPKKTLDSDTITITGKAVVFFSITQDEYDILTKDPNSGIDEVLSDFNYYAEEVADELKKRGYKTYSTASRYIKIVLNNNTIVVFDRLSDSESITGCIITDGKKNPIIDFGVGTDIDFLNLIKKFERN